MILKPRGNAEENLQMNVIAHLKMRAKPHVIFYMVPNAGLKSKARAALDKKMGLLPGVGDLALVLPPNGTAAFIELKVGKNKQTPAQIDFAHRCQDAGAFYAVAYNLDQALNILEAFGAIYPEAELG